MKRPIFAANWKMNHGPTDAKAFMRTFLAHYARRPDRTVLFFVFLVSLSTEAIIFTPFPLMFIYSGLLFSRGAAVRNAHQYRAVSRGPPQPQAQAQPRPSQG